jgi:hypothetical protein
MILISHRGNITGPNPDRENNPAYVYEALRAGFDVEVDIHYIDGKFVLGHDEPQYQFPYELLKNWYNKMWIHCKNKEALVKLVEIDKGGYKLNYFWHEDDYATLTSKGFIWSINSLDNGILVMPESTNNTPVDLTRGVCSDYVGEYE